MQKVETRVLDDTLKHSGYDRSTAFLQILKDVGVSVAGLQVADLGTGFGSLALAAARSGATRVVALDANPERISEVSKRAAQAALSLDCRVANLLSPLSDVEPVDLVFLIGVVEYAGLWDLVTPVDVLQRRVFENAYNLLRPGGTLVFASKNRRWPTFFLSDIHTGQPFVNAMPRALADRVSQAMSSKPYREHIHSPEGWRRLIKLVGFGAIRTFYPYFSYQYPLRLSERPSVADLNGLDMGILPQGIRSQAGTRFMRAKVILAAATTKLGFPITQSVIILAAK